MEDFDRMKEALVWALGEVLGPELTPEVREAWSAAYDIVVRAMQIGMQSDGDDEKEPENNMQSRLNSTDNEEGSAFLKMLGKA
jgi:hemoglobin-like flavoprotein